MSTEDADSEMEEAKRWKEKGNEAFKAKRFNAAIGDYTRSLECRPGDPLVFGNRAQAHLNLQQYLLAQMDCTRAIQLDPKLPKAFYRRAVALSELGLIDEARRDVECCLKLVDDVAAKKLLAQLGDKKATTVVEVSAVERDEFLASDADFVDVVVDGDVVCDGKPKITAETKGCKKADDVAEKPKKTLPAPPTSFADFAADANYLADDPNMFARYFMQIEPERYPSLFDSLLTSEPISLLLSGLAALVAWDFLDAHHVTARLLRLADVDRFEVVTFFFGDREKNDFAAIASFLSLEEAAALYAKYFR